MMRNALLTVTLFSSVALGATGLAAQTQFPMSASSDAYTAPTVGVELLSEGRSAFAVPRAGEFPSIYYDFAADIDYLTAPTPAETPAAQ